MLGNTPQEEVERNLSGMLSGKELATTEFCSPPDFNFQMILGLIECLCSDHCNESSRNVSLMVPEAGKSQIRAPADAVSGVDPLRFTDGIFSLHPPMVESKRGPS